MLACGHQQAIRDGKNYTIPLNLKNPDAKPLSMAYVEAGTFTQGVRKGQPCRGLSALTDSYFKNPEVIRLINEESERKKSEGKN